MSRCHNSVYCFHYLHWTQRMTNRYIIEQVKFVFATIVCKLSCYCAYLNGNNGLKTSRGQNRLKVCPLDPLKLKRHVMFSTLHRTVEHFQNICTIVSNWGALTNNVTRGGSGVWENWRGGIKVTSLFSMVFEQNFKQFDLEKFVQCHINIQIINYLSKCIIKIPCFYS